MQAEVAPFSGPAHQPFDLGEGSCGALLLHGFPGTPAEVRPLGEALAANGWRARGILLPGFGPEIQQLGEKTRDDWLEAARRAWRMVSERHEKAVLIGYSMGGALALHLAAERSPAQMVLIAPFWRLPGLLPRLVPVLKYVWRDLQPFKNVDFSNPDVRRQFRRIMPEADLDDPAVQSTIRKEFRLPMATVHEVLQLGASAYQLADGIRTPTFVIQGLRDELVKPAETRRLVSRLDADQVIYEEVPGTHELIQTHAPEKDKIIGMVLRMLA